MRIHFEVGDCVCLRRIESSLLRLKAESGIIIEEKKYLEIECRMFNRIINVRHSVSEYFLCSLIIIITSRLEWRSPITLYHMKGKQTIIKKELYLTDT